jgi:magnesium-transporting ATPase (P-type)
MVSFLGNTRQITEIITNMWKLFEDKNNINEKNIIGFISFAVMVLFAITDLITSFLFENGTLVINDTIYNSFVLVTLGCFGISTFEKIKTK